MIKRTFLMLMAFAAVSLGVFAQANLKEGFEEYTLQNGMKVYLWVDSRFYRRTVRFYGFGSLSRTHVVQGYPRNRGSRLGEGKAYVRADYQAI